MPEAFKVSALEHRPKRFGEIVGQEHVATTLRNALRLDRLAHAYLFCGPRGVGKTTAARILAKAVNCTTPVSERPDSEPCLQCNSCVSFDQGRDLNLIEIDAASKRRVEDMRDLLEIVRIPPQGAARRVYILDEVHMLTKESFNVMLKTLEEPPPHALFIFATTEPHKVLPTILSRCQRFDFRRIDIDAIVSHVGHVAESQGVTIDDASLMLVARKGDGALRDALSAYDQAVSVCGRDVRYDVLADVFRVVDEDRFFDVTRAITGKDSAEMLQVVDALVSEGYDLPEFLDGLLGHVRNLLVAVSTGSTDLIEATGVVRQKYEAAAREFAEADLLRMMMVVSSTLEALRRGGHPRLTVELGLLKLVHLNKATDVAALVRALKSSDPSRLPSASSRTPGARKAPKPQSRSTEPPHDSMTPPPAEDRDRQGPAEKQTAADDTDSAASDEAAPAKVHRATRPQEAARRDAGSRESAPIAIPDAAPSLFGSPALSSPARKPDQGDPSAHAATPLTLVTQDAAARSALRAVEGVWPALIRSVKADRIHVGSILQHGAPIGMDSRALVVAIPDDFHERLLTNQAEFIRGHLDALLPGTVSQLRFSVREDVMRVEDETEDTFDPLEFIQRKRAESPIVRAIFDEFGGELVW